jgi:hypothetical protein
MKNIKFTAWSFNSNLQVVVSTNGETRNLCAQITAAAVRKVQNVTTGINKSVTANMYEAPSRMGYCKHLAPNMC